MVAAGVLVNLALPGAASAQQRPFIASASAQGVRGQYSVPDFLVVSDFMDSGGPVAQSLVDTTGRSTSFASNPYPGENALSAPGVAGAASGQPIPVSYPFHVRADHPVIPAAEFNDPSGSYSLVATAEAGKAAGRAAMTIGGVDAPVSQSTASTTATVDADGKVTVVAESLSGALSFVEGALRIANLRSRAVTVYGRGDAEPKSETQFVIEGARVGDTAVTIDREGVKVAGQALPAGPGGADPVSQALTQAGVTVRMISGQPVNGGASGDTLEVRSKHGQEGGPQGTFIFRFGGATTSVVLGEPGDLLPEVPPAAGDVPPPVSAEGAPGPDPSAVSGPVGSDGTDDFVASADSSSDAGLGGGGGTAFGSPGLAGTAAASGFSGVGSAAGSNTGSDIGAQSPHGADLESQFAAPAGPDVAQFQTALAGKTRHSVRLLFGLVGMAGAVLLSTSALWRSKGVHATWVTS